MKIALTNPSTWPYLRRGAERFMNELAIYLTARGHETTIISAKAGRKEVVSDRRGTTICYRRLWHPRLTAIGIHEHHTFFVPALLALLTQKYDLAVCCQYMDAYAARVARSITRTPYVFAFLGIPPKVRNYRSLTMGGALIGSAVRQADAVLAASQYVEDYVEGRWGKPCIRIPLPLDGDQYRARDKRGHDRPIILCAAALDEARKGGRLLMRAFSALKATRPQVRLQIAYPLSPAVREDLLQLVDARWRPDVEFVGCQTRLTPSLVSDTSDDLPRLYGEAAISVLPSLWEAYGLVVMESMAAGTPVVGSRSGALPELIATPDVGRLFDPGDAQSPEPTNVDGLVKALEECLDLSQQPETAERCRTCAARRTWSALGPQFEEVFSTLAH
jgi:phosphatidylinositol alpha-mannosyltransferase